MYLQYVEVCAPLLCHVFPNLCSPNAYCVVRSLPLQSLQRSLVEDSRYVRIESSTKCSVCNKKIGACSRLLGRAPSNTGEPRACDSGMGTVAI